MSIFFKCVIQKEFPLRRIKYVIGPDNWDRIYSPSNKSIFYVISRNFVVEKNHEPPLRLRRVG